MNKITLFCLGVMMSLSLGKAEVDLGGVCTQDSNCTDAVCDPRTKTCLIGVAGTCTDTTDKCVTGAACTGDTDSTCACGNGYTANNKLCELNPGEDCTTASGNADICKTGTTCDGSACKINVGENCASFTSHCSSGSSCDTGNICKLDVLQSCGAQNAANCKTGLTCDTTDNKCRYKAGTTCTTGVDRCVSGATCASVISECTCNTAAYTADTGTGICEANEKKVGGSCTAGAGACDDPNASCTNSKCVCNVGYQVKLADATCSGAMGLVASTFLLFASFLVKAQF